MKGEYMGKILVIAEKPSAGRDFATVLGAKIKKDGYLEGDKYIVSWTVGHLITLLNPDEYKSEWKKWDLDNLPIIPEPFDIKVIDKTKKQFAILKQLIHRKDVVSIINGGDSGREGELIQRYVLEKAGNKKPVKRLWVSSLTVDAIREGFDNLREPEEFDNLYESAKIRAYSDWLIGMNYTRGITKKFGGQNLLSVGRCQTPILKLIVDRDLEIEGFKKEPYYEVSAIFGAYSGKYIDKKKNSKFSNKPDAVKIREEVTGKEGTVIFAKKQKKTTPPPLLHNLTSLGQVLNKKYGYSAKESLEILQGLYETHKIVTYPRASAKVISKSVFDHMKANISTLSFDSFADNVKKMKIKEVKRYVNDTKIEDHHAIIPDLRNKNMSIVYGRLNKKEKNVFDVVANSLIAAFHPNYEYMSTNLITQVEGHNFITQGTEIVDEGWKKVLVETSKSSSDRITGEVKKGDIVPVIKSVVHEKQTSPKPRFNEALLLSEMEKYGVGTEATRATLIETLKIRKYIKVTGKTLLSTPFGRDFIEILPLDDIKSIEYTGKFEKALNDIADGTADPTQTLETMTQNIIRNIAEIKKGKGKIMNTTENKDNNVIGTCPVCKKGDVIKGKNGHFFCGDYKETECKFYVGEILGKKITDTQVKNLIEKGNSGLVKGFLSKKNTKFDANLVIEGDRVTFKFDEKGKTKAEQNDKFICPTCQKAMFVTDKVVKCEDEHVLIFKTVSKRKLKDSEIVKLLEEGETGLLDGFISKAGKEYSTTLVLNGEGRIEFRFDN